MKKSPLILTLLSTNLILSSPQNAMEEQIVLDRRINGDGRSQILVLTPPGYMKAKALQESFEQEKERQYVPFPPEGLGDDSELAEAIRLSLEEQTPTLTGPTSSLIPEDAELTEAIRLSLEEQMLTSKKSSVIEEDDRFLNLALSASSRDYEYQQKKIAEEKEALEKERAQQKRNEARKALEEETELRSAQKQSLFSRVKELREKQQEIRNKFVSSRHSQQSADDFLKTLRLQDEETKKIDNQINSLYDEVSSFKEIDDLIYKEIIRLIRGEDPMDLPWMQQLSFTQQGDTPLLSRSSGSLPSIPSSALPNLNSGSLDKK